MKRWIFGALATLILLFAVGCSSPEIQQHIVATTMPVYTFTKALCENTPLHIDQLVQENISCLHDYTITVRHMKLLENADLVVISGGGIEDFLIDSIPESKPVIDASNEIELHCAEGAHAHDHDHEHHHDSDPHYWLSIENARQMAHTICAGLKNAYPQHADLFEQNMHSLDDAFTLLAQYATDNLTDLSCREIITFHDGFSYMAESFEITILKAIEEESGSEASAKELIALCNLVTEHSLPAIFIEKNGSDSAAYVISRETGAKIHSLDMAISGNDYFDSMYHNIDTLKEALE